jgi:hypothetical protein
MSIVQNSAAAAAAAAAAVAVVQNPEERYIQTPGDNDVLCGRGGATNNHAGNRKYRALVQAHQDEYLKKVKSQKKEVASSIVAIIRSRGGGFMKKCTDGRVGWTDIGDKKAREKTSQALREGLDAKTLLTKGIVKQDLEDQNQERAATGTSVAEAAVAASAAVAAAADAGADATAPEADAKRKAETEADAEDDGNKKKAAKTSPYMPPDTDAAKAALKAAAVDYTNAAAARGVAETASGKAPELVTETAPTVPPPAPSSYFDYAASYALAGSAGGYPTWGSYYPGSSYGYDANLYASATNAPAPHVATYANDDDEDDGIGETAQV